VAAWETPGKTHAGVRSAPAYEGGEVDWERSTRGVDGGGRAA
jgi:hypothetical protein